jgi:hypothetical protein
MFATRSAQSVDRSVDSRASHASAFVQYVVANASQSAAVAGGLDVGGGFDGGGFDGSSSGGSVLGGSPGSDDDVEGDVSSRSVDVEPDDDDDDDGDPFGPSTSLAAEPEHPTSARTASEETKTKEALMAPRAKQVPCLPVFENPSRLDQRVLEVQ